MIHTVIVGLLCITAVYYIYTVTILERVNINEYSNYLMNCMFKEEDKEHLLSNLNTNIYKNVGDLSTEKVKNYLVKLEDEYKLFYKNTYLMYDKDKDIVVMMTSLGNDEIIEVDFRYEVKEGKVKYTSLR